MDDSYHSEKQIEELYKILASLNGEEEFKRFFEDMCTFKEIEHMASRVQSAKLLMAGETYQTITSETNISVATLSRVSRCMQHGSGGYSVLLRRYVESIVSEEPDRESKGKNNEN